MNPSNEAIQYLWDERPIASHLLELAIIHGKEQQKAKAANPGHEKSYYHCVFRSNPTEEEISSFRNVLHTAFSRIKAASRRKHGNDTAKIDTVNQYSLCVHFEAHPTECEYIVLWLYVACNRREAQDWKTTVLDNNPFANRLDDLLL